jgi:hypothetical protein
MIWRDLSLEEQCVINNAIDEGDLRGLLNMWDPEWTEQSRPEHTTRLGRAVLALVDNGALQVFRSEPDSPPMRREEIARTVANPRAWWNGDDGLEEVVWLVLTDAGSELLSTASPDDLYAYQRRDSSP